MKQTRTIIYIIIFIESAECSSRLTWKLNSYLPTMLYVSLKVLTRFDISQGGL